MIKPIAIAVRNGKECFQDPDFCNTLDSTKNTLKVIEGFPITILTEDANTDGGIYEAGWKKDIVHNLGYEPLVDASVDCEFYDLYGWRELPVNVTIREVIPDFGAIFKPACIYYKHIDLNTVRILSTIQDVSVRVFLYIEPYKEAWYE